MLTLSLDDTCDVIGFLRKAVVESTFYTLPVDMLR